MKSFPVFLTLLVVSLPSLAEETLIRATSELRFSDPAVSLSAPATIGGSGQEAVAPTPEAIERLPTASSDESTPASWVQEKPASEMSCDPACCSRRHGLGEKLQTYWHTRAKPYLEDTHWGHHEYFIERPFGSFLNENFQTQIANGVVDQIVLYHYDFLDGRAELNIRGKEKLERIRCWMEQTGQPIVIEPSSDPRLFDGLLTDAEREKIKAQLDALDNARRAHVLWALGYEGTDGPVEVRGPAAFGLLQGGAIGGKSEPESNFYNLLRDSARQGRERLTTGGSSSSSLFGRGN